MKNDTSEIEKLSQLDERIKAAKAAQEPAPRSESKYEKASLAWRMVIELVVGMAIGVGIGYGLDSLFGTLPIFLVLFSLFGFAAGVRTLMLTASEVDKKNVDSDSAED